MSHDPMFFYITFVLNENLWLCFRNISMILNLLRICYDKMVKFFSFFITFSKSSGDTSLSLLHVDTDKKHI